MLEAGVIELATSDWGQTSRACTQGGWVSNILRQLSQAQRRNDTGLVPGTVCG